MKRSLFALLVLAAPLFVSGQQQLSVIRPPDTAAANVDTRILVQFTDQGTPFAGQLFGYFQAPLAMEVLGMQIAIQQPDTVSLRIQLTDQTGADLSNGTAYFADVAANTALAQYSFGTTLQLAAGQQIRAKIENYTGNSAAGLVVALVCRQYSSNAATGPVGPPGITSVTTTTLAAGSSATASLSGQVLALGLPQGATGAAGAVGPQGPAGIALHIATAGDTPYTSPAWSSAPTVAVQSLTFTGAGKTAKVSIAYQNIDTSGNQNLMRYELFRSDSTTPLMYRTEHSYSETGTAVTTFIADTTPVGSITYTLYISAYEFTGNSYIPCNGTVQQPTISVEEAN